MMLKKACIATLDLFSAVIPLSILKTISRQKTLLPFYHLVSDQEVPHIKHLYQVRNSSQFIKDLDYLLKHYKPINLEQLKQSVHDKKSLPNDSMFLSFDDGLAECYHIIAPILLKKGIPATFFLNSAFVDNKALMFRYKASLLIEHLHQFPEKVETIARHLFKKNNLIYTDFREDLKKIRWNNQAFLNELALALEVDFDQFLIDKKPYLNKNQIREMQQWGFSFGSHSIDHPRYNTISPTAQIKQTMQGHQRLEQQLNNIDKVFAFPFTDAAVNLAFFDAIFEANYLDLSFGGAGIKQEKITKHLQRLGLESTQIRSSKQIIHSEYCYYLLKSIFGKNTIQRH